MLGASPACINYEAHVWLGCGVAFDLNKYEEI